MVKKLPSQQEQVDLLDNLLHTMVLAIVEHTDQVAFDSKVIMSQYYVGVRVAQSDMGLILGREGETADSIRRVLWGACKKTELKIEVVFSTAGGESVSINRQRRDR